MKKNNIGYLLREGIRGVFLHGFMSFAAIWVTVACLLIMGTFGLLLFNVNEMIEDLERDNEIMVYIDETYSQAQAKSVGSQINMITNVYNATFVSREEAMENFLKEQQDEELFAGIDAATFRDRYVVSLEDNSKMRDTEAALLQINGVADVSAHYEIAEGFQTLQQILNVVSIIVISVLFLVSVLIISNTVKLALYDRKEEIAIMKMVGATNGFIRWPGGRLHSGIYGFRDLLLPAVGSVPCAGVPDRGGGQYAAVQHCALRGAAGDRCHRLRYRWLYRRHLRQYAVDS